MKNSVSLIGNVGGDPETRITTSGTRVTSFSLATSQRWKDKATGEKKEKTEWHRVVCFNGIGKSVEAIVIKGQKLAVDGALRNTKWTDKDGIERYSYEIIADNVIFLSQGRPRPDSESDAAAQQQGPSGGYDDSDVPF
jgi:single-strand DNA-binding protein